MARNFSTDTPSPADPTGIGRPQRFEYRVEQVRSSLVGDKIKTDDLQEMLNRYAGNGWQLKTITSASVSGRMGPGGTSGLVVTFERPIVTGE